MLDSDEMLSTTQPRPVRTFATVQEAVDFLATCLETGTAIQLLAEIYGVSQQVGRSKALVDRFKEVFDQMQDLHQAQDLRRRYRSAAFPADDDHYPLDGDLSHEADLDVQFVRLDRGWVLERIDYL
ncbi:MAG: hypothetical protein KF893_05130 [Caldilineaceae bacterium]|nr:hypothetical protein [Caldilineaceae bacterium]